MAEEYALLQLLGKTGIYLLEVKIQSYINILQEVKRKTLKNQRSAAKSEGSKSDL